MTAPHRGAHRSPPQSSSLHPERRSKKREDEPAQADQEDLGDGSRAASEGWHCTKLQLKRGGMEAKLSRGTQSTWHVSHPLLPSPERVAKQGINGPMQGEGLASPLQLWGGTGGSGAVTWQGKQRKGDVSQKVTTLPGQHHHS